MQICRVSISTILVSSIVACGGAGGDSGLDVPDDAAIEAVAPLVGVWDLPGNWNGNGSSATSNETYLVIGSPDNDGIAEATIYELANAGADDELNCFLTENQGEVRQSFDDQLFLDLPIYNSAIAALQPNGQLEISDFAIGATSSSEPELVFLATRSNVTLMTISELPLC